MKSMRSTLGWALAMTFVLAGSAAAKPGYGTISGVVLDPSGTPQMGATVWLTSEDTGGRTISLLTSNQYGVFVRDHLKPGNYAVRVALAGFLPTIEHHIEVASNLTTLLRVQVDSVFSSLDTLRRKPVQSADSDDWKWVLRSSAATRAILQWRDESTDIADSTNPRDTDTSPVRRPRALMEFTSGTLQSESLSYLSNAPRTAMSYDEQLGAMGQILFAGQMSYEQGASGTFASIWVPSGSLERGPQTTLVIRQDKVGPSGFGFRGVRMDHSEQFQLGDRVSLRAGAEYLRVAAASSVSAIYPHARLGMSIAPGWTAFLSATTNPLDAMAANAGALQSAITQLDTIPTVLLTDNHPYLEGAWHQELSLKHRWPGRATLEVAVFRDAARHEAVVGSGAATDPAFLESPSPNAFLYDGGSQSSWGTRLAYRQKISDDLNFTAVYAWAGALSPAGPLNVEANNFLDNLTMRQHNSLAAQFSKRVRRTGTEITAGYKWVSGPAVTRLDAFGEAAYQIDPNLHLMVRQKIPCTGGHWQAMADFSNLLAQGYVPVEGQSSRTLLMPVLRSLRGGLSFQF